jgi:hypothetical protein
VIVLWWVLGAALVPLGWHAVAEHHVHLRALHLVRPRTVIPVSAHHSWWHSLPRLHRAAIQAALLSCGAAFGVAYPLAPAAVAVIAALAVAAAVVTLAVRAWRARRLPGEDLT